jgi:hypothetical protein
MPGNPHDVIAAAERRFPVRVRVGIPSGGLGQRLTQMTEWLDGNCGSDAWAITPSGMRGVRNDAISIYFANATLASAFVMRWCAGSKVNTAGGVSKCEMMSRRRGSQRGCIGRREPRQTYRRAEEAIAQSAAQSQRDDTKATIRKSPLLS